jgi:hypothetical protein
LRSRFSINRPRWDGSMFSSNNCTHTPVANGTLRALVFHCTKPHCFMTGGNRKYLRECHESAVILCPKSYPPLRSSAEVNCGGASAPPLFLRSVA